MVHPTKRKVAVKLFTDTGWISGHLHVPPKSRLLEHLNHAREFVSLTDVRFTMKPEPIPFLAVQRETAVLIVASASEVLQNIPIEEMVIHQLSCLLPHGTLYGKFRTLKGVRVSDYISAVRGFFVLEDCNVWLTDRFGRSVSEEHHPHVLVNVKYVIGVTEVSQSSSGP